jgi:hypothetical protein
MTENEAQDTAKWLWILVGCAVLAYALAKLGEFLGQFF